MVMGEVSVVPLTLVVGAVTDMLTVVDVQSVVVAVKLVTAHGVIPV
jgi:hypothetical protein